MLDYDTAAISWQRIQGDPKSTYPLQMIINRIKSLSMRFDLFVKVKYQSSTIILFVGIRYFMCDLFSDLNNLIMPDLQISVRRRGKKRRLVVEVESLASSWKKLQRVDV